MTSKLLEGIGWKARGDRVPEFPNPKAFFPRWKHTLKLIPLFIRVVLFTFNEWWHGREAFIDIFNVFKHSLYTGVPLGGIGCGSIGTDFRGAFNKFSIIPGIKEQTKNIKANQFIVAVRSKITGDLIYQSLLSCADFSTKSLASWKTMPKENVSYRGLFPRAWTEFKLGNTGIFIICEQLSPVIPHDYQDSSLPVSNFEFHVVNESNEDIDVSIAFTFRNGTGNKKWEKENLCQTQVVDTDSFTGRTLHHTVKGMQVTYGIGTMKREGFETSTGTFDPNDDGKQLYRRLGSEGKLADFSYLPKPKELGIAVCSKFETLRKSSNSTTFSLAWYMPEVHFGTAERVYTRRYARFFGGVDPHQTTEKLCAYANEKNNEWKTKIEKWQKPILEDVTLPEWYRSALFNELYYIVDGSTTWFEYDTEWKVKEPISKETELQLQKYGRFGYMESWEYFMINTYDVHFYSSWAILKNWPQIELSIQLDFADQVSRTDKSGAISLAEGTSMEKKKFARIPHDMGHPMSDPWIHTNAYILHDTSDWKDLNLKFVLSSWRDWKYIAKNLSNSNDVLQMLYEKCKLIIDRALQDWDVDGDGMIENSGFADQTYDVWTMTGTSAYCGSLWIASLEVFVEMGKVLQQEEDIPKYSTLLKKSYSAFEKKLWNGKFYSFDENPKNKKVVMADQLSGFWALTSFDEKVEIEDAKLISALREIYKHNVQGYSNGEYGAVNGFLTSGEVDSSSIQSEEVWSGITYALSSLMIELGLTEEAFKTSEGLYNSVWCRYPLQFQTPEAITSRGMYRALGYMRPMSIWAIQHSLEKRKNS